MQKRLILLFLLMSPIMLHAWVGSNAIVRLIFPQSYAYKLEASWALKDTPKEWQSYSIPAGVYGIVYNPNQGIDKHQIILEDLATGETALIVEVENHNKEEIGILTGGDIIKAKVDAVVGKKYKVILRAFDLNGETWDDTAIIQTKRR